MAVYRIYPDKDTFLFSEQVLGKYGNAGRDEILEIGGYPDIFLTGQTCRTLISFSSDDIVRVIGRVTGSFQANLHLYVATATNLPVEYNIYTYPVSSSWVNGTGKRDDIPLNTSGVSWKYRGIETGSWFNLGGDYLTYPSSSQFHDMKSSHDINIDISEITNGWISGSLENNGILLKIDDQYEAREDYPVLLKYFGGDTNTIFPPYLEIRWDDSQYSSSIQVLDTDQAHINLRNYQEIYSDSDMIKFRLGVKPKYPPRTFSTASIYMTEYILPQESYWAIKDEFSEEMIVDFNSDYTKISADQQGSYFTVYMDTLQPERYYRILVKTTIAGNTLIMDNRNIFKVVRNG